MASKSSSEHVPTEDDSAEAYKLFANVIERMSGDPEQNKQLLGQLIRKALFVLANEYVEKQQTVIATLKKKPRGAPRLVNHRKIAEYIDQIETMKRKNVEKTTKEALRRIKAKELKQTTTSPRNKSEIARWVKKMENQISAHKSRIKKFKPSKLQAAVLDTPENPEYLE